MRMNSPEGKQILALVRTKNVKNSP